MTEHSTPLRDARKASLEEYRISRGYTQEEVAEIVAEGHRVGEMYWNTHPEVSIEADEMAREYFEGIHKLNYLKLFGVVGRIEFTGEGNIDWDKTFKVSA